MPGQEGQDAASIAAQAAAAVLQQLGLLGGPHQDNAGEAASGANAPSIGIRPVTIKAPPFWPEEAGLWFVRLEAQFDAAGITQSKTKFNHVVAALDNTAIQEVSRVVRSPTAGTEYEDIKTALTTAFGRTQAAKDAALFAINGLGDRKPSSLFRYIDGLASDRDTLVQAFFLAQLPSDVRGTLAANKFPDGETLAAAADRIMDSRLLGTSTNAVATTAVEAVTKSSKGRNKTTDDEPFICFKHRKYGLKARGCQRGCLFADAPLASSASGNAMASRQ